MKITVVAVYACLLSAAAILTLATTSPPLHRSHLRAIESYARLPLSFEANLGQAAGEVRFLSRGTGYSLLLTRTGAVFSADQQPVAQISLLDANPSATIHGMDELPGKSNYFLGNDPAKWRTNVPTYAKVHYQDIYPGIDLVYYGNQRQLEYDFVVAPGADPHAIRFAIGRGDPEGSPYIDDHGDLVLEENGRELRLHQPIVYQTVNGTRQSIYGTFVIEADSRVGFELARYDATQPLIIDPVLSYSTYLGGSGNDQANAIAVDSSGNVYVTGSTTGGGFPSTKPFQAAHGGGENDVFITKLNAAGTALVYSTFLGGKTADVGRAIAVDSSGNVYVTGMTDSANFPTASPLQAALGGSSDAFVAKLNATGSALVYSTYLGGKSYDLGGGIAVDSSGNAYVTGATNSADFPTAKPIQAALGGSSDLFIAKMNPAGSALVYSTYIGGSSTDEGAAIALDSAGNVYVTGNASSENFPTVNPMQANNHSRNKSDAFVTKLNAAGSAIVYSTYYGGSRGEYGQGIAVDSAGNAYITGYTDADTKDLPRVNAFQQEGGGKYDAFVAKLNAAGSALVYSTYLGGKGDEFGAAVAVDSSGNAYVTGSTTSNNFPTLNPIQPMSGGNSDAFLIKYDPAGVALASSYFGGKGDDYGSGIALDSSGNVYVVGYTDSKDFPTAKPFQAAYGGGSDDVFVTKFLPIAGSAVKSPQ